MSQVLLWSSLAIGVVVFLYRFLPLWSGNRPATENPETSPEPADFQPVLRIVAFATPFVGFLVTLPTQGIFSKGQQLGIGFLLGGLGVLLQQANLKGFARNGKSSQPPNAVLLTATNGIAVAIATLPLLFLHASLLDALMGIAIGWFCTAFAFYLALSSTARWGDTGKHLAAGVGMMVTLIAGLILGIFRDPVTASLPKLTWATLIITFAAAGTLLCAGSAVLTRFPLGRSGRLIPLFILVAGSGMAMYQLTEKLTSDLRLAIIGIGGLLLWPVVYAVQRETGQTSRSNGINAGPAFLAIVVVTSGFVAALQTLQGVGAAMLVLALWLAFPAAFSLVPDTRSEGSEDGSFAVSKVALLLFATVLLLWRLCTSRWTDELHGVNLTDQYALFGLILGVGLPQMLGNIASRWQGGKVGKTLPGIVTLVVLTGLAIASPAVVVILFGAKSVAALLIGLALGSVPALAGNLSLLPGLLAIAIALVLDQWTGFLVPEQALTRVEKIRWLVGVIAVIVTLTITVSRLKALPEKQEAA